VWQVADMANALQFIESNIEDLDNENVQAEINAKFKAKVDELVAKHPNLRQLTVLGDSNGISIKEKEIIYDILRKSDTKLRNNINDDIQRFVAQVKQDITVSGIKWDDIALNFEWISQKDQIEALMKGCQALTEQDRQVITLAMQKQATKFDA
jgi:predicted transcriptional regulator